MSKTYITIRDMDDKGNNDGGRFFLNEHSEITGYIIGEGTENLCRNAFQAGWGQYSYKQRRQARRAAKALAVKLGIPYRQDKEYTIYNPTDQIVAAPVTI